MQTGSLPAEQVAQAIRSEEDRQKAAAEQRVRERRPKRRRQIAKLQDPAVGLAQADTLERVATRVDRLSKYVTGEPLPRAVKASAAAADPAAVIDAAVRRAAPKLGAAGQAALNAATPADAAGLILEAIVNTVDFVGVRYLEAGTLAAQAVARVDVRDANRRNVAFATGSMVSPRLLLTNHHVLEDERIAALSQVEFNFQDGLNGKPLTPVAFGLDPRTFFLSDPGLDFTLVAIAVAGDEDEAALAAFGHNPLIAAEGKAIVGDFVTIVQHPEGHEKQVALRDNRVVDVFDDFLHYATDTEPGSSGSPVFNDQWEVVALHHAGVSDPSQKELGGVVNEGIRVSRILAHLRAQDLTAGEQALLAELQMPAADGDGERAAAPRVDARTRTPQRADAAEDASVVAPGTTLHVRIPLDVVITVGAPVIAGNGDAAQPARVTATAPLLPERIEIDPDYTDRRGYDPDFLGTGPLRVALPRLPDDLMHRVVRRTGVDGPDAHILDYHHYSVVLDGKRRLAFFVVVNIDGAQSMRLKRESDRWSYDPRVPREAQTGEDVYEHNDLDRGHLVRRLDPAWGLDVVTAKRANDDTFHFTNCTPQHKDFNQHKTLWAGLEDYLLDHADTLNFKATIFTGPVLADGDDAYRGVQLPRQFWKVAVMVKTDGRRTATGYLLSQAQLIKGLEEAPAEFDYGAYRTFQVPVSRITALTRLDFGALAADDPLAQQEATGDKARELGGPEDLVL
jgi:endonuclease G, mitochondrial